MLIITLISLELCNLSYFKANGRRKYTRLIEYRLKTYDIKTQSVSNHTINFLTLLKMAEISEMDWAQHIMMDYAQNLRKDPKKKAKQTTFDDNKAKKSIIN